MVYYTYSVFPEQDMAGFRYLGKMSNAEARAQMTSDDLLLAPEDTIISSIEYMEQHNDPRYAVVFSVEHGSEEDTTTGSWALKLVEMPKPYTDFVQDEWQQFLHSHSPFEKHIILIGLGVPEALKMFQKLAPSEGSVVH